MLASVIFLVIVGVLWSLLMADATSPVLVHPRTTLSTNLSGLKGQGFMKRTGPKMDKLSDDLVAGLVSDVETYDDEDATVDTATTTGEFFIELLAEIVTAIQLATLKPLDLNVDWVPHKIGDFWVLTGDITTASLVRFETLTGATSGATAVAVFSADFTVGTGAVVVVRLLAGTPEPGGEQWDGASGEITTTSDANQVNRCPGIGGRLKLTSTGAAHAAQTSIPVSYIVEGTKVA